MPQSTLLANFWAVIQRVKGSNLPDNRKLFYTSSLTILSIVQNLKSCVIFQWSNSHKPWSMSTMAAIAIYVLCSHYYSLLAETTTYISKKNPAFFTLAPNSLLLAFFARHPFFFWTKTRTTTLRMHSECHNRLINLVRDFWKP